MCHSVVELRFSDLSHPEGDGGIRFLSKFGIFLPGPMSQPEDSFYSRETDFEELKHWNPDWIYVAIRTTEPFGYITSGTFLTVKLSGCAEGLFSTKLKLVT
jgi:hypothetical protein